MYLSSAEMGFFFLAARAGTGQSSGLSAIAMAVISSTATGSTLRQLRNVNLFALMCESFPNFEQLRKDVEISAPYAPKQHRHDDNQQPWGMRRPKGARE